MRQLKTYKPKHEVPGAYWLDYILLPYGEFYAPTREIAEARRGDILRFFNGPEYPIERVIMIPQDLTCDLLCRMRYGIPWSVAFKKWQSYAVLEGNDRGVLSKDFCLWVIFSK